MSETKTDIYMQSEIIGQKIKYSPDLNMVIVDDKNSLDKRITYTMDEISILRDGGIDELPQEIHAIKKIFAGTIVRYTPPVK
jgi:hypothetical protein